MGLFHQQPNAVVVCRPNDQATHVVMDLPGISPATAPPSHLAQTILNPSSSERNCQPAKALKPPASRPTGRRQVERGSHPYCPSHLTRFVVDNLRAETRKQTIWRSQTILSPRKAHDCFTCEISIAHDGQAVTRVSQFAASARGWVWINRSAQAFHPAGVAGTRCRRPSEQRAAR